ncbi:hypothetical protein CJ030_MR4G025309 [Morella rubra]|uniref:Uncharacterized protein n=1 Tax=Morella rubra TaxID=262757 RepID=A0A6A1VR67_9ROSI|nr:hypothetical protein CJ030_MR4G025309 [Morella rubra]
MKQQEYTVVPPSCNQPRNDEESANLQPEELHRKNMRNTRINIGPCAFVFLGHSTPDNCHYDSKRRAEMNRTMDINLSTKKLQALNCK